MYTRTLYIVQREKKTLGVKRLDLDAAKNHTKKQSGEKLQQVTLVVVHVVVSTHTQSTILQLQWKAHTHTQKIQFQCVFSLITCYI